MAVELSSEIRVEEVQQCGSDAAIVAAARVSTQGWDSLPQEEGKGLLRFLMRHRHGTPFEHGLLTCRVHAPAFVWWEWVRHRFQAVDCPDLSYNLESGRYRELKPVFWVPRLGRPMITAPDSKPARPNFLPATGREYQGTLDDMEQVYEFAWLKYLGMVRSGVASEVARAVLGFGIYYAGWVSGNPRALLQFLSLRVHDPQAKFATFPQQEIQEAAVQVEALCEKHWPLTIECFREGGRVAP